jgi:hypothetical protein
MKEQVHPLEPDVLEAPFDRSPQHVLDLPYRDVAADSALRGDSDVVG